MVNIDEAEQMLEEIAAEIPVEFFNGLNGGILLLPEIKYSSTNEAPGLFTLGEYHRSRSMGSYIIIYYGSLTCAYGHLLTVEFKDKLRDVLLHEFTHHLESRAGTRDLEKKDEQDLERYRENYFKRRFVRRNLDSNSCDDGL